MSDKPQEARMSFDRLDFYDTMLDAMKGIPDEEVQGFAVGKVRELIKALLVERSALAEKDEALATERKRAETAEAMCRQLARLAIKSRGDTAPTEDAIQRYIEWADKAAREAMKGDSDE